MDEVGDGVELLLPTSWPRSDAPSSTSINPPYPSSPSSSAPSSATSKNTRGVAYHRLLVDQWNVAYKEEKDQAATFVQRFKALDLKRKVIAYTSCGLILLAIVAVIVLSIAIPLSR